MADKLLDIQIVRALKASGPLARKQILARVNDDPRDVEASLDAMLIIGCVKTVLSQKNKGQFVYQLKTGFGEIDCKRAEHRQKVALYVSRNGATSQEVIPVSTGISFSEGLDRAIWKAANTGRWMMVREIRDILISSGFRKDDVISRVQYHINTGKWFERQSGHRNNQFFMLRDGVECPELPGWHEPKPELRGETRVVATLDDAELFPSPFVAPDVIASNPAAMLKPIDNKTLGAYFPMSMFGSDIIEGAMEHTRLLVKADGTLSEAIWAILGDGEEYSSADIVMLMKQFGYTSSQISPLLSKRFAEGLLTRRLVMVDGRWVNVYKKAGELPEKYTMQKSVVSDIVKAQQPQEKKVISATQEIDISDFEPPELFDSRIRIKGIEIDIVDFATLYKELSEAGFVRDMHKPSSEKPGNRLLTTTHVIKGVPFERDELSMLAKDMYNLANRFKLAILV
jgi:hypothetical protein